MDPSRLLLCIDLPLTGNFFDGLQINYTDGLDKDCIPKSIQLPGDVILAR